MLSETIFPCLAAQFVIVQFRTSISGTTVVFFPLFWVGLVSKYVSRWARFFKMAIVVGLCLLEKGTLRMVKAVNHDLGCISVLFVTRISNACVSLFLWKFPPSLGWKLFIQNLYISVFQLERGGIVAKSFQVFTFWLVQSACFPSGPPFWCRFLDDDPQRAFHWPPIGNGKRSSGKIHLPRLSHNVVNFAGGMDKFIEIN